MRQKALKDQHTQGRTEGRDNYLLKVGTGSAHNIYIYITFVYIPHVVLIAVSSLLSKQSSAQIHTFINYLGGFHFKETYKSITSSIENSLAN